MFSSQATASQLSWLRLTPNLATYTALMKAYAKAACSGSCKVTVLGTPSFRLEIFICRKQNTSRTLADLTRAARHNMTQWCKHLQAGWKLTIQLPTKETAKTWKMPLLIKRACNVWGPRSADGCFRLSANRQAHHPHKAEEVLDRLKAEGNKLYYSCTTVVQWKCVKYILNHLDTTRKYESTASLLSVWKGLERWTSVTPNHSSGLPWSVLRCGFSSLLHPQRMSSMLALAQMPGLEPNALSYLTLINAHSKAWQIP